MIALIESFGVIPLQKTEEGWKVFLILHKEGHHWGFPKGRKHPGEEPLQAAQRELFEETGLSIVKLLSPDPLVEDYSFRQQRKLRRKRVYYFIAEVGGEIRLQPEEIREGKWSLLSKAAEVLTFLEARSICDHILKYLT
ncbi:MAG: NUDIX domain-containing protein [Simkania sp.]|nr:NUDIX domain-containing protein [Simkania sp.]